MGRLELSGALDLSEGAGLALLGEVFEFIVLPIWLIAKGFRPATVRAA